jgi:hypothetical protein
MKQHFLFLGLLCAFAVFLSSCRSTQVAVTSRTGHLDADWLEADINYPAFEGFDELNTVIADYVESDYREFKAQYQDTWQTEKAYRMRLDPDVDMVRYAYYVSPRKAVAAKRYISVVLAVWNFTGGAHGSTVLKSFVYDKKTRSLIPNPSALGFSYDYLAEQCRAWLDAHVSIADQSKAALSDRKQWIEAGSAPKESNYTVFAYDGKILTVYFAEYQVAPYSEGIFEVPVTLAK